jgi:hypothetical protein
VHVDQVLPDCPGVRGVDVAGRGGRCDRASAGFHADPGGQHGLRYFDGEDRSPYLFLEADPASPDPDDREPLSRVSPPLDMLTVSRQPA